MNRIKKFKMNPETAYRFAIGELQIESKDQLRITDEMQAFFVLNAEEEVRTFITGNWGDMKLKNYLNLYHKVMSGEPILSSYEQSAECECYSFWEDFKGGRLFGPTLGSYQKRIEFQKQFKIPNALTDEEKEIFIKSPKWAVKYAKFTKERFPKSVEERLLKEECPNAHSRKTSRTYVLEYCKMFNIILDNYNEILLTEGFGEKSKFSKANKDYLKKIQQEKEDCKSFLIKIIEANSLSEEDSIKKLMECFA